MCSIIDRLIKIIVLVALFAPVVACSDEVPVVEPTVPQPETGLRFGIKQQPESRVVNSGLSSEFADGDSIGCVIAFRNASGGFDYQCTTSWLYNSDNGMLVLDHYYYENGDKCVWRDADPNNNKDVICRHPDYSKGDGYVQLNKGGEEYCFFFYYPFINNVDVDDSFQHMSDNKDVYTVKVPISGFALDMNPNWDDYNKGKNKSSITLIGFPDDDFKKRKSADGTEYPHFKWTSYPCYASIAQGSKPQLDNSNVMWVRYVTDQNAPGTPITADNKDTHYTVNLQFRKKMAAIDLVIDDSQIATGEGDIYYRNIPENENFMNNGKYSNYIIMGKRLDLSTGKLSDYPFEYLQWRVEQLEREGKLHQCEFPGTLASHLCDSYEDNDKHGGYNKIRPCPMGGGVFCVILPPQESFKCELHFKRNGKEHVINLYPKIPVLKENTLYTIRLKSLDDWEIIINDWQKGPGMLIEEDK